MAKRCTQKPKVETKKERSGERDMLIAIIRDKDHVLIGVDKIKKLDSAIKYARKCKAHCYIPREGYDRSLREQIGRRLEDDWQYYWRF